MKNKTLFSKITLMLGLAFLFTAVDATAQTQKTNKVVTDNGVKVKTNKVQTQTKTQEAIATPVATPTTQEETKKVYMEADKAYIIDDNGEKVYFLSVPVKEKEETKTDATQPKN